MDSSAANEMFGLSQRKNGTRKRDVCGAEKVSVEPININASQIKTGNQYLRKSFTRQIHAKPNLPNPPNN